MRHFFSPLIEQLTLSPINLPFLNVLLIGHAPLHQHVRWPMQIGHWVSSQWQLAVNLTQFKRNRRAPKRTIKEESQIQKTLLAKKNVFLSRISSTALTLPLMSGY